APQGAAADGRTRAGGATAACAAAARALRAVSALAGPAGLLGWAQRPVRVERVRHEYVYGVRDHLARRHNPGQVQPRAPAAARTHQPASRRARSQPAPRPRLLPPVRRRAAAGGRAPRYVADDRAARRAAAGLAGGPTLPDRPGGFARTDSGGDPDGVGNSA